MISTDSEEALIWSAGHLPRFALGPMAQRWSRLSDPTARTSSGRTTNRHDHTAL